MRNTLFLNTFMAFALLISLGTPAFSAETHADRDHDGIPDDRDKCPDTAQLRKIDPNHKYAIVFKAERRSSEPMSVPVDAEGCDRDTDGDGVADYKDFCPENSPEELSAGTAVNGCPKHSDKDSIPDYRDNCPNTPAGTKTDRFGCPA